MSVTERRYDIIPMHHNCRYPYDYRQKSFASAGLAPFEGTREHGTFFQMARNAGSVGQYSSTSLAGCAYA